MQRQSVDKERCGYKGDLGCLSHWTAWERHGEISETNKLLPRNRFVATCFGSARTISELAELPDFISVPFMPQQSSQEKSELTVRKTTMLSAASISVPTAVENTYEYSEPTISALRCQKPNPSP